MDYGFYFWQWGVPLQKNDDDVDYNHIGDDGDGNNSSEKYYIDKFWGCLPSYININTSQCRL